MKQKPGGRPTLYPLAARLQAKALYLGCKSYQEIETATGIPRDFLRKHQNREGWAKLRQSPEARAEALQATERALREFTETIAVETQSLSLDAVPVVRDAIDRGSARDLKDSAQGLKTLVEIARMTSGIDSKDTKQASALGGVNMFFFAGKAERVVRDVMPVVPVVIQRADVIEEPEFD